jgi:hypothetical protein
MIIALHAATAGMSIASIAASGAGCAAPKITKQDHNSAKFAEDAAGRPRMTAYRNQTRAARKRGK